MIEATVEPMDDNPGWWQIVIIWPNGPPKARPIGFAVDDDDLARLARAIENLEAP